MLARTCSAGATSTRSAGRFGPSRRRSRMSSTARRPTCCLGGRSAVSGGVGGCGDGEGRQTEGVGGPVERREEFPGVGEAVPGPVRAGAGDQGVELRRHAADGLRRVGHVGLQARQRDGHRGIAGERGAAGEQLVE